MKKERRKIKNVKKSTQVDRVNCQFTLSIPLGTKHNTAPRMAWQLTNVIVNNKWFVLFIVVVANLVPIVYLSKVLFDPPD